MISTQVNVYIFCSKNDRPTIQNIVERSARQSSQTRKELRLVGVMILATWSLKHKDTFKIHANNCLALISVASFNQIQIIFKRFDFYYNKNSNISSVVKIFSKFNVKIPFRDLRWAASVVYYLKALVERSLCRKKKYILAVLY